MRVNSVLITGANRGIGLEFVKQFAALSKPPRHIIATCRDPLKAQELNALQLTSGPNVKVLQLDVSDESSISVIGQKVSSELSGEGLNLLINNAGVLHKETLETVTSSTMMETFMIHTVGPLLLIKELLPLLKTAASQSSVKGLSVERAAVVNISSFLGSIHLCDGGAPSYSYRTSKAAINMVTKSLANDLKKDGILVSSLHPGYVQTNIGGADAWITTTVSVDGMMKVMKGLGEKDMAKLITYEGDVLPW